MEKEELFKDDKAKGEQTSPGNSEKEVGKPVVIDGREKWGHKADFILSSLGYCVGFGNIWRFPYLAYRNGGASFLIPYFLMLALNGVPLFFLELAIGQWFSSGVIGVWKSICPLARGIGYSICLVGYMVCIYYVVILAWVFLYLFESFRAEVPWKTCDNYWNSKYCFVGTDAETTNYRPQGSPNNNLY